MVPHRQQIKSRSSIVFAINMLSVALFLFLQVGNAAAELRATKFEMKSGADRAAFSLQFDSEPTLGWFQLGSPYRLVVELPTTAFALERETLRSDGMVTSVRYGLAGPGRSRLILSLAQPFLVERLDVSPEDGGYRLSGALKKTSSSEFRTALDGQNQTTASIEKDGAATPAQASGRPFTVVIDAGHGGFDGGAEGRNGTVEKDVTLAFAKELQARLGKTGDYVTYMTRDDDRFLRLDERVDIARARAADLFISIHADTIRYQKLRGATVYTGSDKASDAEAEALAERENHADHIAGMPKADENPDVADILTDFVRRETQGFSTQVAGLLVRQLSKSVGVINNPHRHARFRVLSAPDVPSVLIELGYLSNSQDEKSLVDPVWRAKAADSIAAAVAEFASPRAPNVKSANGG